MGDANFCSEKWNDIDFTHKRASKILKSTLQQRGIDVINVGVTYKAYHAQKTTQLLKTHYTSQEIQ